MLDELKFSCTELFLNNKLCKEWLRTLLSGHRLWVVRTLSIDLVVKDNKIMLADPGGAGVALKKLTGREQRWALRKIEENAELTPCHVYVWRSPFHITVKAETELGHYGYESAERTLLMEIICHPINFCRALWICGKNKWGGKAAKTKK